MANVPIVHLPELHKCNSFIACQPSSARDAEATVSAHLYCCSVWHLVLVALLCRRSDREVELYLDFSWNGLFFMLFFFLLHCRPPPPFLRPPTVPLVGVYF